MGRLIVHQQEGRLEMDGFLLRSGDRVEIRLLGIWFPGSIDHDQHGWYFLTTYHMGIRLYTGLSARALSLSVTS